MNDTRTASLVLVAGAAGVAWWYWHLTSPQGALASPAAPGGASGPGALSSNPVALGRPLDRLEAFARQWGLPITSTTGGQHAPNSLHYQGRAIDVGVRGLSASALATLKEAAAAAGIHVLDEQYTGQGPYGYSSGPHLHLSIPTNPGGPF